MSEFSCPICKNDSYLNPDMVLYVSPCYHKMCESCLIRHFANGINNCPECGIELRKINYMTSTFEDIEVERECRIRRQVYKYYNKQEEDFKDIEKYNDYLEEVEKLVFDLMNYKSESLVKKKLNEVLEDKDSILNMPSEKKVISIKESVQAPIEYKYIDDDIKPIIGKYEMSVVFPSEYLDVSLSGGVSKDFLISYCLYYLQE